MRPGDIILFADSNRAIKAAQKLRQRHSPQTQPWLWTHAAVYVDADHLICEASLGGVKLGNLEDAVRQGQKIEVFRHPDLDEEKGRQVARAAVDYRGNIRYAWEECIRFAIVGKLGPGSDDAMICSTLCERALLVAGVNLVKKRGESVTPAFLSQALRIVEVAFLPVISA